ncbi:nucleotide pyrophosphohydrolase [Halobacteriovorax sp. DPLXC-1]|uniref:nucleotide pyrophosphohydrolase n=1 Tax=Halobacteriovorax sp. DPLXC-1 TaxID=3110771 RepID=UPI002FF0D91A
MSKEQINVEELKVKLRKFAEDRDWDQFHSPKNLSMALSVEVSELVEIFQWLGTKESLEIMGNDKKRKMVEDEVADIFYYLLRITDKLEIDLESVLMRKMIDNEQKYPVELSKGSAKKYTELEGK